jgi:hypothetical protein
VLGQDVWSKSGSMRAKELIGALPDGLAPQQRLTVALWVGGRIAQSALGAGGEPARVRRPVRV